MKRFITLTWVILTVIPTLAQIDYKKIDGLIEDGYFAEAHTMIASLMRYESASSADKWQLRFRVERMERIKKDFTLSEDAAREQLIKYYPDLTKDMLALWDRAKSLEMKIIDGKKWYFAQAVRNLFRINKDAKQIKLTKDGPSEDKLAEFLSVELPEVVKQGMSDRAAPRAVRVTCSYTLTVDKNAVPAGEIVKCWLPYPKETRARQSEVKVISTGGEPYVIASDQFDQRTLYMQKPALQDSPTVFNFSFSYLARSDYRGIDFSSIKDIAITDANRPHLAEEAPHIVFDETVRKLSAQIVGSETHKGTIIMKLFEWIDKHIPWASAREYSTIPNIPLYAIENGHGDCGIQTLLFITLCRYNGIPAKWQSGWMLHPGAKNLHDWCEIWLDTYGWVPVDQSFGLQPSDDPLVRWFFLGNTDAYHLIVNEAYSQPLFPEKIYPRSETVDFQRGEVEWKGGNLYFDQWDYSMEVSFSVPNE
jgi:transglutaminase-like putative cysteine protease